MSSGGGSQVTLLSHTSGGEAAFCRPTTALGTEPRQWSKAGQQCCRKTFITQGWIQKEKVSRKWWWYLESQLQGWRPREQAFKFIFIHSVYVYAGSESDIHLATLETQSQNKHKNEAGSSPWGTSLGVNSYTYASSSKILSKKWDQEELFRTIELKTEDLWLTANWLVSHTTAFQCHRRGWRWNGI